jgi:hypothetical protein
MIAYAISGLLLKLIGFRSVLTISFMLSLIGMLALIFVDDPSQAWISVFILGSKFGVSATFNLAYLGNVMLFPTVIVSTSFGICNIFSRVSTITAPFVAELKPESISKWVFCGFVIVATLASLLIK